MSRYVVSVECSHPGCRTLSRFEAETRREEREIRARKAGRWLCRDHFDLDIRLSPERSESTVRMTATKGAGDGLYWFGEGVLRSGFQHGPGFTARAKEWPEGTILEVTARIILPGS